MNIFNRIVMILIVLFLVAVVAVVVAIPLTAADQVQAVSESFKTAILNQNDTFFFFSFLAAAGILLLLLFILLWFELRRPARKTVQVKTQGASDAQLAIDSVAQSLEYRIDELAGVRKVRPRIISNGGSVEVNLDLDTSPSVNIPALTDQVVSMTQEIVGGQLGLKMRGKVHVNIHHEPYPRGTMPVNPPLAGAQAGAPVAAARPVERAGSAPAPVEAAANKPASSIFDAKPVASSPAPAEPKQDKPSGNNNPA